MDTTKPTKKLTSYDIKSLLEEGDKLKDVPTFKVLGITLDKTSFYVMIITVILWIILWFSLKIFGIIKYSEIFFIAYIIISILNLFNSATNVSDIESERMNMASQQSFIQGGIAVFILAFVFLQNINMEESNRIKVYKILVISLIISCIGIVLINVKNVPSNVRFIRKIQQAIFNQGLVLFLLALYMIYTFKASFKS
jgi:hypothetical protein